MNTKIVTRIDLEKAGSDVIVREWFEGWAEGDPADIVRNERGGYIVGLLMRYEAQGYTCEMPDAFTGRALRGKITRIDFVELPDGCHVRKYPFGWSAKTKPISDQIKNRDDYETVIIWCTVTGWNVRRWPGGARAFKGAPMPVRDRAAIMTMRRKVESEMAAGHASSDNRSQYDFALDF